jgi:hypothetical protein
MTSINDIENEVIYLNAIREIIDSVVNFEVMKLYGSDPNSSVLCNTTTHQKYFNIILTDFLSNTDGRGIIKRNTYLGALKYITTRPNFNINSSVLSLQKVTSEFDDWLFQKIEVESWLPSIGKNIVLKLSRSNLIKICGNISKHNYLRSMKFSKEVQKILLLSGISVDLGGTLLVLGDFYTRFHVDVFNYHISTIAEFLNDIRWEMYEYLKPEWERSIQWEGRNPPMYKYRYPQGVSSEFAKECYWNLMNDVRVKPFMRRFKVDRFLKLRY